MAFTRKYLSALGIEADKVDEIITAHTEVTDALKTERDKYKTEAEKLPAVEKELNKLKEKQPKEGEENAWKVKYETLKEEHDNFKTTIENEKSLKTKNDAFVELLKAQSINPKLFEKIAKLSDIDKLELDEEGKIKGADKLAENVKAEWGDFIVSTETKPPKTATPPRDGGGGITKDDFKKMTMSERSELYQKDPDTYKKLKGS